MNTKKINTPYELSVTPLRLGDLILMIKKGIVSLRAAKKVLDIMEKEDKEAPRVIEEQGLRQVCDPSALHDIVEQVLYCYPGEVKRYRDGENRLLAFFTGQVMKATEGRASPGEVNILIKKLAEKI